MIEQLVDPIDAHSLAALSYQISNAFWPAARDGNGVARHWTPGLLRLSASSAHAHTKGRQVVVEEIDEMIAVDFDDQIRFGLIALLANCFINASPRVFPAACCIDKLDGTDEDARGKTKFAMHPND